MDTPRTTKEKDTYKRREATEKSSCSKEGDQSERAGEQERTDMFFSKSVLRTQQETVVLYPEPITDLLWAIDELQSPNTEKSSHMYHKWIHLHGPNGEKVRMQAVIDGGAMRNTMCTSKWHMQRHR